MGTDSKPAARAARIRGLFGERGLDADGISAGAGRGIANLGANRGLAWCPLCLLAPVPARAAVERSYLNAPGCFA